MKIYLKSRRTACALKRMKTSNKKTLKMKTAMKTKILMRSPVYRLMILRWNLMNLKGKRDFKIRLTVLIIIEYLGNVIK